MNQERDKFLTEAMGKCWHQLDYDRNAECIKCGKLVAFSDDIKPRNNFSTWKGFGKLAVFVNQKYGEGPVCDALVASLPMDNDFPSRFASKIEEALRRKYENQRM